jgi:hypothetical protein
MKSPKITLNPIKSFKTGILVLEFYPFDIAKPIVKNPSSRLSPAVSVDAGPKPRGSGCIEGKWNARNLRDLQGGAPKIAKLVYNSNN